jgi:exonuclease SbcC
MIPLRVKVKNFLCYEEQEFKFDDHPVWLLHGPNGVGKSTVFDAIVYALFGETKRNDARDNAKEDVIRHGASSMLVEFEFEVAGERYLVKRTRQRGGVTKQRPMIWKDGDWEPIPNADRVREVDDWIENLLGLGYSSFASTILLRQGAAEKLIDLKKADRQELFERFIDIGPFVALADRIAEARGRLRGEKDTLEKQLKDAPKTTDVQIAAAVSNAAEAASKLQSARATENETRDRLGYARQWEQASAEKAGVERDLAAAADRAARSDDLKRLAERCNELAVLEPALRRVIDRRDERIVVDAKRMAAEQDHAAAETIRDDASLKLDAARRRLAAMKEEQNGREKRITDLEHALERTNADLKRAVHAEKMYSELEVLRVKKFDVDLDGRFTIASAAVDESQRAHDSFPSLKSLAVARSQFLKAADEEAEATRRRIALEDEIASLKARRTLADESAAKADDAKNRAAQDAAVAEDQWKSAEGRRTRFDDVRQEPLCSECGQAIGPDHVQREIANLDVLVARANENRTRLKEAAGAADDESKTARDRLSEIELALKKADGRLADAIRDVRSATLVAKESKIAFGAALTAIGDPFVARVGSIEVEGYPSSNDLVSIQQSASRLPIARADWNDLVENRRERDQTTRDLERLNASLGAFGVLVDAKALREASAELEATLDTLRTSDEAASSEIDALTRREIELSASKQSAENAFAKCSTALALAAAAIEHARQRCDEAVAAVPDRHRTLILELSRENVERFSQELDSLRKDQVVEQFDAYKEDLACRIQRETLLGEIDRKLEAVPIEARIPASSVQASLDASIAATREAEVRQQKTSDELGRLTGERTRVGDLETRRATAERGFTLHEKLAKILGPDGIQRDLVSSAWGRIVAQADEILGRLSSGDLRFVAPDLSSLDPFDLSIRVNGLPVNAANLSGGQRFRVAVSLALAVCQGTGESARRLESIIIDEGFGSLDREGRAAMVAELRDGSALAGMFKRIIVVSHQDDFADAFPVRYQLSSVNGSTQVEAFGI